MRRNRISPNTGVTVISSSQASEDDGRRFRGIVPSAMILITRSIRRTVSGSHWRTIVIPTTSISRARAPAGSLTGRNLVTVGPT